MPKNLKLETVIGELEGCKNYQLDQADDLEQKMWLARGRAEGYFNAIDIIRVYESHRKIPNHHH